MTPRAPSSSAATLEPHSDNTDTLLATLNNAQREAVTHRGGPLLIIAGAGTGKTTVITRRIAHLIATKQARPDEILALTFSEKAAREMEERVDQLVPYGYVDTTIATFHAFGDQVLREQAMFSGLQPGFDVLTKRQMLVFIQEHLYALPFDTLRPPSNPTHYLDALIQLFTRAKDGDISPSDYQACAAELTQQVQAAPDPAMAAAHAQRHRELAQLYEAVQGLMREHNRIEFGDQIALVLQLFRTQPTILSAYQQRFKYVLVDEFQDTNYAQFELITLLTTPTSALTLVADDDQSIYRFRGAAVANIINFFAAYPTAEHVVLSTNYRSTQPILDAAYRLIRFNDPDRLEVQRGIDKRLRADRPPGEQTHPPEWQLFDTVEEESNWVTDTITERVEAGMSFRDCVILVRSNKDAEPFVHALTARGIPWQFPGVAGVSLRAEVRLLMALLRAVADPADSLSWYYVAASQLYAVPAEDILLCNRTARQQHRSLGDIFRQPAAHDVALSTRATERVGVLLDDMERFVRLSQELTPGQLLYRMLTEAGGTNYLKYLADPARGETLRHVASFFEQLHQLESQMRYVRLPELLMHADMLQALQDDPRHSEQLWDADAIQVLTAHRAKGLEFPVVFMVGLVQGRFPVYTRREALQLPEALLRDVAPTKDTHLQEERRLFYVGMTRAKDRLYLSAAGRYGGKSVRKVSQFVMEALDLPVTMLTQVADPLRILAQDRPTTGLHVRLVPRQDMQLPRMDPHGIDDYLTCPLKYKFTHRLRVPIMQHHAVIYGGALHTAIEHILRAKQEQQQLPLEQVYAYFEQAWRSEGFLTRAHEDLRFSQGQEALRIFWEREASSPTIPTHIEERFECTLDPEQLRITGRYDRVDVVDDAATIIDYKSSDVQEVTEANARVRRSIQMMVYALVWFLRYQTIPTLQLHFLGSQVTGEWTPAMKHIDGIRHKIVETAHHIQAQDFHARPAAHTCRWCAYRQICPQAYTGK